MTEPLLSTRLHVTRAEFDLEVELSALPGEVIVLVGPNGAGKSTLLRTLAGLVGAQGSHIKAGGIEWQDGDTPLVPTHRRRIGLMSQDPLLFPHLDVRSNIAFGLRMRGTGRRQALATADGWLSRMGLAEYGSRRPQQLSGGQRQRVALARSLATEPDLLLLDEPFSALDVGAAAEMRTALRDRLAEFSGVALLVTHDPIDALTLADRVCVMEAGRVVQDAPPWQVATQPTSAHAARLAGLNVLVGTGTGTVVALPGGIRVETGTRCDGPQQVTLRPSAVTLATTAPTGSARNKWHGRVVALARLGDTVRVELDVGFPLLADVLPESVVELGLEPGAEVWATAKATELTVLPAKAGQTPSLN